MAANQALVMTLSTAAKIAPPSKPSEFAHIPTPIVPRRRDDFFLYIILGVSPNSTCSASSQNSITIDTLTTYKCDIPAPASPYKLRTTFAKLPVDMRKTWNRFVAEMHSREELKNTVIVLRMLDTHDGKTFFRVSGADRTT